MTFGIAVNGKGAIEIGHVPGRQRMALYEVVKGEVRVFAFFKSDDDARECATWLEHLACEQPFNLRLDVRLTTEEE